MRRCTTSSNIDSCGGMPMSLPSVIAEAQVQEPMRRQEGQSQGDRQREAVREQNWRELERELESWRFKRE